MDTFLNKNCPQFGKDVIKTKSYFVRNTVDTTLTKICDSQSDFQTQSRSSVMALFSGRHTSYFSPIVMPLLHG